MKRKYLLWLIPIIIALVIIWYFYYGAGTPKGQPPLKYITEANVNQFEHDFDSVPHEKRLVLLLSPT